jgi:hypothetical protein
MPVKSTVVWEALNQQGLSGHSDCILRRARVPGGWLVLFHEPYGRESGSIAFYPDPHHVWDGGSLAAGAGQAR